VARHTAATSLVATGTDIRTTRGYTDVAAELKREAVERMSQVLLGGAFDPLVPQPVQQDSPGDRHQGCDLPTQERSRRRDERSGRCYWYR
jgi:hypothetical protein